MNSDVELVTYADFWAKVEKADGCWLWRGCLNRDGYGQFSGLRPQRTRLAHRLAYLLLVGPIPEGLEIDHLCRVRHCVNPAHLEAVAHRTNILRSPSFMAQRASATHCKHGHAFTPDNTRVRITTDRNHPRRACRACARIRGRVAYRKEVSE